MKYPCVSTGMRVERKMSRAAGSTSSWTSWFVIPVKSSMRSETPGGALRRNDLGERPLKFLAGVASQCSAGRSGIARCRHNTSRGENGDTELYGREKIKDFNMHRPRTGRSDQTAVVLRYARAAELALASRARGSREPRPQAPLPSHPNDASRERPPAEGTGEA
jgi:hypothetical protein